jgi:hypothetical protein
VEHYKYIFDCFDRVDGFRIRWVKVTVNASDEEEAREKVKELVRRMYYDLEEINTTNLI